MQLTVCVLFLTLVLRVTCADEVSVTVSPERMSAVPDVCAVISCTYTGKETVSDKWWQKCSDTDCKKDDLKRLKLLDSGKPGKNCSVIIESVQTGDAGLYQFKPPKYKKPSPSVNITVQEEPVISVPPLTEGEQATLNCSAPDPCPTTPANITWRMKKKTDEEFTDLSFNYSTEILNQPNKTQISVLSFSPSADLHGAEVQCAVNYGSVKSIRTNTTLTVTYVKNPRIEGNLTVTEGGTLSLTCSAESHPPSLNISWTFGENMTDDHQNTSELIITNVSSAHAGEYTCTVQQSEKTLTASVNITVIQSGDTSDTDRPKIQNGSGCVWQNEDLMCTCISDGPPLPHITWPETLTHSYHIQNHITGSTVSSTITLHRPKPEMFSDGVKCVSKINDAEVWKILNISQGGKEDKDKDKDKIKDKFELDWKTILTFLFGVLSTAIIVCTALCFMAVCKRCRTHKTIEVNPIYSDFNMDAVQVQNDQADADQTEEDEQTPLQPQTGGNGEVTTGQNMTSGEETAGAAGGGTSDMDYACIDYSRLEDTGAHVKKHEETEYAEIQIKNRAEGTTEEPQLDVEAQAPEVENQEEEVEV